MTRQELAIEYVDPATLVPAPYNPREISEEALERLATLIDNHGWVAPVIARREDRLVIGGHQRLRANLTRETPDKRVPVVFLKGVDDTRAAAMNVALNNRLTQGDYDYPKLVDLLEEIDTSQLDVSALTGFNEDDLDALTRHLNEYEPDVRPEIQIEECFQVVTECKTEHAQRELYERLAAEGYLCRLLVL